MLWKWSHSAASFKQMKLILSSSDECVRKALFVIKRRQWWGSVAIKTNFSLVSSGSYQSRQGWMSRCFTCAHFSSEKHNFHLRNSRCSLQWVRLTFAQMREKKIAIRKSSPVVDENTRVVLRQKDGTRRAEVEGEIIEERGKSLISAFQQLHKRKMLKPCQIVSGEKQESRVMCM